MYEPAAAVGAVAGVALIIALIVMSAARAARPIAQQLSSFASSAGWQKIQAKSFPGVRVQGVWNGINASISHHSRDRSAPERLITVLTVTSPERLFVRRRFERFFSSRPLTFFGPPLVEARHPSASTLWIRADEPSMVDRLFSNADLVELLRDNLVERFDEVKIDRKMLRITRALDEKALKQRYGRSGRSWRFHEPTVTGVLPEEWGLAAALANHLSLRG